MNNKIFESEEFKKERYLATKEDLKFIVYYISTPLYLVYWFTTDLITVPQLKYYGLALRLTIPLVGIFALKSYKTALMKRYYYTPLLIFIFWGILIAHSVFWLDLQKYDYNKYFSMNHLVLFGATIFTPLPAVAMLTIAAALYLPYIFFLIHFMGSFSYHEYITNLNVMAGTILMTFVYNHLKIRRIRQNFLQKRALLSDATVGSRISQIVHDLRTPLQALTIAKEMGQEDSKGSASLLDAGLKRIQKLCQEILDTRKSPYYMDAEMSSKELEEAIAKECSLFHPKEWLKLNFSSTELKVFLDISKIQRLVANLVSNAFKAVASQKQPHIEVEFRLDSKGLHLKVIDNGIGFDAYQKSKDYDSSKIGHGIGLEFCKQVCDYYGGQMNTASQPGNTVISAHLPRVFL